MTDGRVNVQLGDHEYIVVPQRVASLSHKLGGAFGDVMQASTGDASSMLGQAYTILKVLIPDLMPEYEFQGYASESAMKSDSYREEDDHSPTVPEIIDAIKMCAKVNGGDVLGALKDMAGPELIRAWLGSAISANLSSASPSSQPTNGASVPMTSGTPAPTAAATGA